MPKKEFLLSKTAGIPCDIAKNELFHKYPSEILTKKLRVPAGSQWLLPNTNYLFDWSPWGRGGPMFGLFMIT